MELLSTGSDAIQTALPSGGSGNVQNSSAVQTLRQLMEEVGIKSILLDIFQNHLGLFKLILWNRLKATSF